MVIRRFEGGRGGNWRKRSSSSFSSSHLPHVDLTASPTVKMAQFECPGVIHPLYSLTFGALFTLHTGKGKCCMWSVKKWKFNHQFGIPPGHSPHSIIHFCGPMWDAFYLRRSGAGLLEASCLSSFIFFQSSKEGQNGPNKHGSICILGHKFQI